jgi:hypothetical protein
VNAAQAAGNPSNFATYQFSGSALCGTSCGNSTYQSIIGTDYDASPNRPQDYSDDYAIATYFQGAQAQGNNGTLSQISGTCNGSICTGLIAAASCYAAPSNSTCGTGGTSALALQFADNDTRSGTYIGSSGCTWGPGYPLFTVICLQTNVSAGWNTQATTDRKSLIAYEGGWASYGPSAAYLSSIGDGNASTDATNINNLLIAYRSSSLFYNTYLYWNSTWFGNSQVVGNSNLGIQGAGGIGVNSQNWFMTLTIMPLVTYQNYNAFQTINYLFNRDLDPVSNDNSPVGLNKAA